MERLDSRGGLNREEIRFSGTFSISERSPVRPLGPLVSGKRRGLVKGSTSVGPKGRARGPSFAGS